MKALVFFSGGVDSTTSLGLATEKYGVCGTCRDRQSAFEANGVSDPALNGGK